jgi:hypothetical protein
MLEELHHEITNLSCFQRSTFFASIKIFNSFPHSLTILKNDKAKFKAALRKHLNTVEVGTNIQMSGWQSCKITLQV